MPCPLCHDTGSPRRDWSAFLRRLGTVDRERLLRELTPNREAQEPARSGRWLSVDGDSIRVRDPQSEYHSDPSDTIRQDE